MTPLIKYMYLLINLREVLILKHFGSLGAFWETFERMRMLGQDHVTHRDRNHRLDRSQVETLLSNDDPAIAMYNLLGDWTCKPATLNGNVGICDEYRIMDLRDTIDLPPVYPSAPCPPRGQLV